MNAGKFLDPVHRLPALIISGTRRPWYKIISVPIREPEYSHFENEVPSSVLKKLILSVMGLAVGLAIAEGVLRLTGFGMVTPQMNFGMHARIALDRGYFLADPTLFWKVRPGISPDFERRAKFVHPDSPIPPHGNKKRLIVLGDSCSRVTDDDLPYSAHLEAALGRDEYEVLNASVPGYTSFQGLAWLRSQLLAAEPDVVVVYFGWNDHWRTTGKNDLEYARSLEPTSLRLLQIFQPRPDTPPFRVSLDEYRENLKDIIDEVTGRGGEVILIAAPYRFSPGVHEQYVKDKYLVPDDDAESLHREYLDVLREFIGREGVSVLAADEIIETLKGFPLLRADGIHLTDPGHLMLGTVLAECIRTGEGSDGTAAPALLNAARGALEHEAAMKRAGRR